MMYTSEEAVQYLKTVIKMLEDPRLVCLVAHVDLRMQTNALVLLKAAQTQVVDTMHEVLDNPI